MCKPFWKGSIANWHFMVISWDNVPLGSTLRWQNIDIITYQCFNIIIIGKWWRTRIILRCKMFLVWLYYVTSSQQLKNITPCKYGAWHNVSSFSLTNFSLHMQQDRALSKIFCPATIPKVSLPRRMSFWN